MLKFTWLQQQYSLNTITCTLKLFVLKLKRSFELLFLQLDPGENSILNEQCSELYDNRPDERPNRNGEQNDAADFDRRSYKLEPRWSRPNCLCLLTIFHRPTGRVPRVIITLVNHSSLNQFFDIFSANTKYLRIYFLLLWQPLYLLFYKESVTRCTVYGMLSSELYICCLATMILTSSSSYKNALQR